MSLNWNIGRALDSYASLCDVVNRMTEDEIHKALEIESSTKRRTVIINRLIARLVRMNELRYVAELREKYART
jgi:hypothetical protein